MDVMILSDNKTKGEGRGNACLVSFITMLGVAAMMRVREDIAVARVEKGKTRKFEFDVD